jgi:hypothetical protein
MLRSGARSAQSDVLGGSHARSRQDVDPPERNGVYVQKVHGEDGLGLCREELAPGRT